jgi:hypothetical protein
MSTNDFEFIVGEMMVNDIQRYSLSSKSVAASLVFVPALRACRLEHRIASGSCVDMALKFIGHADQVH